MGNMRVQARPIMRRPRSPTCGLALTAFLSIISIQHSQATSCEEAASRIISEYRHPECSTYAEQSSNYRRVTVETPQWCSEGQPCRQRLAPHVQQFRTGQCQMKSSENMQAAARAILNMESCGFNAERLYCGQLSELLYHYAREQQASNTIATVDCNKLLESGDLKRLGCCVATFTTMLTDMGSTAASTWRAIKDQCSAPFDISNACPLLGDVSSTMRGNVPTWQIVALLSIVCVLW